MSILFPLVIPTILFFIQRKVIVPGMLMLSLSAIGMMTSTNGTQLLLWLILWSFGSTAIGTAPVAYVTDVTTPTERYFTHFLF